MNRRDRRRAARALGLTKAQRQALDRAAGLGRVTRVEVEGDRPASSPERTSSNSTSLGGSSSGSTSRTSRSCRTRVEPANRPAGSENAS